MVDTLTSTSPARHCISVLTTIEIRSAIRRLESFNEITPHGAAAAVHRLSVEHTGFQVTEVSAKVLATARHVVDSSQLRALDAIQLATALLVAAADSHSPMILVASDRKLLQAAQASGLTTLNPEEPTSL